MGKSTGVDAFLYLANNPVNLVDALGLQCPVYGIPIDMAQANMNANSDSVNAAYAEVARQEGPKLEAEMAAATLLPLMPQLARTEGGNLLAIALFRFLMAFFEPGEGSGGPTFVPNPVPEEIIEQEPRMEGNGKPVPSGSPPAPKSIIGSGPGRDCTA